MKRAYINISKNTNELNHAISIRQLKIIFDRMKTLMLTLVVLLATNLISNGQEYARHVKTRYGIELSQFITSSGFASGTELYFKVIPDNNKRISFGVFFCNEEKKISGVTMHHEIVLIKNASGKTFVPCAFYNLIYRFTKVNEKETDNTNGIENGLYKSLEHHLGVGLNVNLSKSIYVKGGLGYGVYFGSIKKNAKTDKSTGEAFGSNGFGAIGKVGLIYIF